MKIIASTILLVALTLFVVSAQKEEKVLPADTLFKNGNIYTVNDDQPNAEAIAVQYGKIVFVGSNADAKKYEVKGVKVVDLKGKTVVPGLADAHYHLCGRGLPRNDA